MQVKQRLQINSAISIFTAVLIFGVFCAAAFQATRAAKQAAITGEIIGGAFEKLAFRNDYIRSTSTRAKEQWFSKHQKMEELLAAAAETFQDTEHKQFIDDMRKNQKTVSKLFTAIVENRERLQEGKIDPDFSHEIEDRLLSQLNMKAYEDVLRGRALQEESRHHQFAVLRLAGWSIFGSLVLVIAATLTNAGAMAREITARVGRLRDGAAIIGGGNLDHTIDIKGNDEFAELAEAFNAMTQKLRTSHLNLEKEIEGRKRAQENLRQAHDELELRVQERTDELKQAQKALEETNSTLEQRVADRTAELQHQINERIQAEELLRRAHDELEQRVKERTAALAATVETLHEEIDERQKAEEKALRLNRLYVILTETNKAIVRHSDRDTLFRDFCRAAVDHGGFLLAWVGLVDRETGEIKAAAAAGATGYLDDIALSARNEPIGTGPTGISIREGTFYICNNFVEAEVTRPWHERGRAHGIGSSASIAISREGRVIGALTLYSREKDFFDEQQVGLLRQMGNDISFGLDNLVREERRRETEEALIQSQKMETVGRLAGGIAHDFNNLLMIMSGFAEEAEEACHDAYARELLGHVIAAGAKAKELTQKLLTFSRQQVMQKTRLDIRLVVEEILRLLNRVIGENIEVAMSLPDVPLTVNADQGQIEQVITNIVINARDAMISGGKLDISLCRSTEQELAATGLAAGDYAVIEVQDTGHGIAASDLRRIFEPFFSTKELGKGTGLGLSIAYSIVKQHDGTITVESVPGNGSRFRIFLPLVKEEPDTVREKASPPKVRGGEKVLLVEDDQEVRLYLKLVLERSLYSVIEAVDGEHALETAASQEFGILITDVLMPKMNGMELQSTLKQMRPNLKCILMSGYSSDILDKDLPDDVVFLQKPVTKDDLLRVVESLCGQ